ncbi:MAG: alpha-hydroxy-acid oxidizing enzyme [Arcobacter sp.]|nr:MAG: alpha-hydroxy-acid oxidizing enzyme [Arcobacter sp.]
MTQEFNPNYPSIDSLRERAKYKIPGFAFEYVDGGCNEEINLHKNTQEIRELELKPYYLRKYDGTSMKTELFGETYDTPFGISPVGLQGLIWPGAPEILAKAAFKHNIPYTLSTVSTASIEKIAEITEGKAWFQLYHPAEESLRDDLMERCKKAGIKTFVILSDVPTFGYRNKEIKNGLAIPPRMTLKNILQIMLSPEWAIRTLIHGQPAFKTLEKYMTGNMNLKHLALFMDKTFDGRMSEDRIKAIRDKWKGNLVLKGVASVEDTQKAVDIGVDGVIVSNHGGRQLDAGESSIKPTIEIVKQFKDQIKIMMDSGIRTGPDIARTMAAGADFCFMGRAFMYGVGALGEQGGDHTITILKRQLQQVLDQCCCATPSDFPNHLVK